MCVRECVYMCVRTNYLLTIRTWKRQACWQRFYSVSGNRLFRFVFHLLAAYTAFPGLGVCVALFVHMVSWSINKSCVGVLHMQPWEGGYVYIKKKLASS